MQVTLPQTSHLPLKTRHYILSKQDFSGVVNQGIQKTKNHRNQLVYLFFYKSNISKLQVNITQMNSDCFFLSESTKDINLSSTKQRKLLSNPTLIVVYNPYWIQTINEDRRDHVVESQGYKKTVLSHQVLLLSKRILYSLWGLGGVKGMLRSSVLSLFYICKRTSPK
jgi:hypothetical protein